jgi:hypothetical protein
MSLSLHAPARKFIAKNAILSQWANPERSTIVSESVIDRAGLARNNVGARHPPDGATLFQAW